MEVEDIEALERDLYVEVHVEAEDEDDQCYRWTVRVPCCKSLLPLRAQWAEAHGVIEAAVGFEDYLDREVDLQRTPQEHGWSSKSPVYLHAVPVDDRFAEGAEGELPAKAPKSEGKLQAVGSRPVAAGAARTEAAAVAAALAPAPAAKRQKAAPAAPAAQPAPAAPAAVASASAPAAPAAPAAEARAQAPALESALARRLAAQREKAQAPIAVALNRQPREAAEPSDQAAGFAKFAPLTSCTATIDLDDEPDAASDSTTAGRSSSSLSTPGSCSSAAPAAPAATAETAAAPLRKRLRPAAPEPGDGPAPGARAAPKERSRGGDEGACPLGSESVSFDVRNPKKMGTGAYERYSKYKEAKTPTEALRLGASKADLVHDYKKGFMRRC